MSPLRGPDQADDLRLSQALKSGQPHALADLNAAYGPWLYDYAHALLRDRDWAADALYDALLTVRARAATVPPADRLRGWLYGVVRDECLARLADPGQQPAVRQEAADAVAAAADDPVRLAARRRIVLAALAELTSREREIADLTLRHGLGAVELAEVLGISAREAAEQALAAHAEIARVLKERLGKPVDSDRLPGALEVLPFAMAPAGLSDRVAAAAPPPRTAPEDGEAEKARLLPAIAAAGSVVLLVGLVYLVLPGSSRSTPAVGAPQVNDTTAATASLTPDGSTPSGPATGPTTSTASPTRATGRTTAPAETTTTHRGSGSGGARTTAPGHTPPGGHTPPPSGALAVDDSGCQYVSALAGPASCTVTLTARSALHWSVVSGSSDATGTVSASGSGPLGSGGSASVTVTITPKSTCNANGGGGSGTISFSPAAQASVSYLC